MKAKKYVKLYNRVWEALHADDKFVVTSDKTHEELVAYLTRHLESKFRVFSHLFPWEEVAEACIDALVCQDEDA